ncbi:DsbC family protein [Flavobacterium sp.]|uniref:DsbC family protein n=1 Tax=Flavobacterium sp. TaxID=239 RepID=UPI0026190006|nr:DsbC family protein [Flavobacterium sp.]
MKKILPLILATVTLHAGAQSKQVITNIENMVGPGKVDKIVKSPVAGLFEVHVQGDVIYADPTGKHIIVGKMYETSTKNDLTQRSWTELNKIDYKQLPFELAIKQKRGNGSREVVVFEDPNCGYCKRLRQTLNELDNITVYTFQFNILSEDSRTKSRNIWCAADPGQAWDNFMLRNIAPPAASEACRDNHDKVLDLGKKLKVAGTPALFFVDGSRIPGAVGKETLEKKLAELYK